MSKIVCEIWVCRNCMLVHANGECGEIHAESCAHNEWSNPMHASGDCTCGAKEPLSQIPEGHSVTLDGPERDLDTSACAGCGQTDHGPRYQMTLWDERTANQLYDALQKHVRQCAQCWPAYNRIGSDSDFMEAACAVGRDARQRWSDAWHDGMKKDLTIMMGDTSV